jgi:hypothetical protein
VDRLVVVGGELDGLDDGAEQVLGVQRLAGLRPAPRMLQPPLARPVDDRLELGSGGDPDDRAASGAEPGRCRAQPVTAPGWIGFGLSRLSPPGRPGGLWPGRRASRPAPIGRAERRRR